MSHDEKLPSQSLILDAMLIVLRKSQRGLHIRDIEVAVAEYLSLTRPQMELMHKGKRTLLGYKLAWARTAAKKRGLIESPQSSIWKCKD
jgi:hypothetical protein